MSFLGLNDKTFAVFGVSNKKSVGYFVGRLLEEEGAKVVYVCLLYTSPSPRDLSTSRMPSSA